MTISFSCTQCDHAMTAPDEAAERIATCPECGQHLMVPEKIDAPPDIDSRVIAFYEFPVQVKKAKLSTRLREKLQWWNRKRVSVLLALLLFFGFCAMLVRLWSTTSDVIAPNNDVIAPNGEQLRDAPPEDLVNLTADEIHELKERVKRFGKSSLMNHHGLPPSAVIESEFTAVVGSTKEPWRIPLRCVGKITARNLRGDVKTFTADYEYRYNKPLLDLTTDLDWIEKRRRDGTLHKPLFANQWYLGLPTDPFVAKRERAVHDFQGKGNQTTESFQIESDSWNVRIYQDNLVAVEPKGAQADIVVTAFDADGIDVGTSKPYMGQFFGPRVRGKGTYTLRVKSNCGWKIEVWQTEKAE